MAKTRAQKEEMVQQLARCMQDATSVVFANFQGLKVAESDALRQKCREQHVSYIASKKTLLERALKDAGIDTDARAFEGGVAVMCGNDDEVAPAQIVANFAKDHEVVSIFGGILEGAFISRDKVNELSKLPSKQALLAKVVGSMNAPVSGFVNVLAGNLRGLVNVLNAVKDAKA